MIPALIETVLNSFTNMTIARELPIWQIQEDVKAGDVLVALLSISVPCLTVLKDQLRIPIDTSMKLPAHPQTLLEELQAKLLARGSSANESGLIPTPLREDIPSPLDPK